MTTFSCIINAIYRLNDIPSQHKNNTSCEKTNKKYSMTL